MNMINDSYIKEIYGESGRLNSNRLRDSWLNDHKDIKEYLEHRYSDSLSFKETIYRIRLGIEIRPVCPVCGGSVTFETYGMNSEKRKGNPFLTYCSVACQSKSTDVKNARKRTNIERYGCSCNLQNPEIKEKSIQTNIKKYGVDNPAKSTYIKKKMKETSIARYGVENPMQLESLKQKQQISVFEHYGVTVSSKCDEVKNKMISTNIERYGVISSANSECGRIKSIQTSLRRYGTEHPQSSDIIKQKISSTNLEKYGVDNCMKLYDYVKKSYDTRKQNGTYTTSSKEDFLFEILNEKYVCLRQYSSDVYKHECDYYIPEFDLYIEYNGTWTHGEHPYDEKTDTFVDSWREKSKMSEYYKNACYVYTKLDPQKLRDAIDNKLNYLSIYRNIDFNDVSVIIEQEFTETTKNKQLIIGTK